MAIAQVFCVFSEEAAAGILAFLPVVSVKEGGRRFFEVTVAIALAALVAGQGARALAGGIAEAGAIVGLAAAGVSLVLAIVALRVLKGPGFDRARPWLGLSAVAAFVALAREALAAPRIVGGEGPLGTALELASVGTGAALLGSVLLAMILGHFY